MFEGDEQTFEHLLDKLVSFASVKHKLKLDDTPNCTGVKKDPNAMEVDTLSKGGNSKFGQDKYVTFWICKKQRQTEFWQSAERKQCGVRQQ